MSKELTMTAELSVEDIKDAIVKYYKLPGDTKIRFQIADVGTDPRGLDSRMDLVGASAKFRRPHPLDFMVRSGDVRD